MAQESDVSDLFYEDLIEVNSKFLNIIKILKKQLKETCENHNKAEFERDTLKDEKIILEEELEKVQENLTNSDNQISFLSQEIETQK